MSVKKIKQLSMNPHFYSLLIQGFLSGYQKPCDIKLACMAIPILLYSDSREQLVHANSRSSMDSLFSQSQKMTESNLSGKVRLSGYIDRYNMLRPYCKKAVIISYSENKIAIKNQKIVLKNKIDYKIYEGKIKEWMKCSYYLGIIFSKTSLEHLSFFLGVDIK